MKYLLFIALLSCSNIVHCAALPNSVDMALLTPIAAILAEPHHYVEQEVTISGTVTAVCEKRGCWAEISNKNKQQLRIKVRDGNTAIPMSALGKTVIVTGTLSALNLSKQQAILYLEHMAQDTGQAFDRHSVNTGITIYNLRPNALKLMAN